MAVDRGESVVHFVVPAVFDDPDNPSGGNFYDQQMARRLPRHG